MMKIFTISEISHDGLNIGEQIKKLIMKINSTNTLITEVQVEKDNIEYQIEQCHINGGVHHSLIDEHRKNIMISKTDLERLKNEIVDKDYKIYVLSVELDNLKAIFSILQKKNTLLHENSLKP